MCIDRRGDALPWHPTEVTQVGQFSGRRLDLRAHRAIAGDTDVEIGALLCHIDDQRYVFFSSEPTGKQHPSNLGRQRHQRPLEEITRDGCTHELDARRTHIFSEPHHLGRVRQGQRSVPEQQAITGLEIPATDLAPEIRPVDVCQRFVVRMEANDQRYLEASREEQTKQAVGPRGRHDDHVRPHALHLPPQLERSWKPDPLRAVTGQRRHHVTMPAFAVVLRTEQLRVANPAVQLRDEIAVVRTNAVAFR